MSFSRQSSGHRYRILLSLLHWQAGSLPLDHLGSLVILCRSESLIWPVVELQVNSGVYLPKKVADTCKVFSFLLMIYLEYWKGPHFLSKKEYLTFTYY